MYEGNHSITVYAEDEYGNLAYENVSFTLKLLKDSVIETVGKVQSHYI